MNEERRVLVVRMPAELYEDAQLLAAEGNEPLSALVRRAIQREINRLVRAAARAS